MVSQKTGEELPPGWKEHVKVKNGRKIKVREILFFFSLIWFV